MSKKKISQLDAAAALDGTESIEAVQAGANVKTTTQAIANLASALTAFWKVAGINTITDDVHVEAATAGVQNLQFGQNSEFNEISFAVHGSYNFDAAIFGASPSANRTAWAADTEHIAMRVYQTAGNILLYQIYVGVNGIQVTGLPTSDPGVANALWNDNGTVKISAG